MTEKVELRVKDFDCPSCASTVEKVLKKTKGVKEAKAYYETGRVEIKYEPNTVKTEKFREKIQNQGYTLFST